ncbi:MAG: hypothetical protein GWN46_02395, partial [Gammaproteobacteria bacterium]|nr:hypothetical protein [Gammaproteobacteria bacterium]
VIRFVIGSALEWVIGKPTVLAVMGFAAFTRAALVPAAVFTFRVITWAPAKLVGGTLTLANRTYPA